MQWNKCKNELKCYCIKCYIQTKACERDKKHKTDDDEQRLEHIETDEDDSDQETDTDGRFSFTRTVPDEVPLRKRNDTENEKRNNDAIAADKVCERSIAN